MLEASKAELKKQVDDTNQALETLRLQLEKQRDDKIAMEKLMEERRLERQDMLEHMQTVTRLQAETKAEVMVSAMQQQHAQKTQQAPQMPAINITMPKRGKKVGKITTDKSGNPMVEIEEQDDETDD
jgi:chromosome segregation ATPase